MADAGRANRGGSGRTRRGRGRTIGTIATAIGFTVVVAALLLWLGGAFARKIPVPERTAAPASVPLPAGTPTIALVELVRPRTESAVGTVEAERQATVASRILSRVVQIDVEAGRRVAADEVLALLDDTDLRQRLEQAQASRAAQRAALDQAQDELVRAERSAQRGAATELEVVRARNAVRGAEAELQRAERAVAEAETVLGHAVVRAPFAGVVIERTAEVGDTVVPGSPLLSMYDPERMQLVASVRESLSAGLRVGGTVRAEIESLGLVCEAAVAEIVPEASARSRSFRVKVTGPCPPGVYPGMFGRLHIPVGEERVLAIPVAAVRRVGQLDLVDVVTADAGVVRRLVRLGRTLDDGLVEVLAGLRAGETIVAEAMR